MAKTRKALSPDLRFQVLYASARTCCVCRDPKNAIQIHHIDQNPANNVFENLAILCQDCHDEAHTKHALSQNLTAVDVARSRDEWVSDVSERSAVSMTPRCNADQALWTYFHHERLHDILTGFKTVFHRREMKELMRLGAIDSFGSIQSMLDDDKTSSLWTLYDQLPHSLKVRVHHLYSEAINNMIIGNSPIDLDAIWTRSQIQRLCHPGSLLFTLRGFHFRDDQAVRGGASRLRFCHTQKRGIRVEFRVFTHDMFGVSAICDSFSGHRVVAALFLLKTIEVSAGVMTLHCTPVALGSGFLRYQRSSPYHLFSSDDADI